MRQYHLFNQGWLYREEPAQTDDAETSFHPVTLPHTNTVLPYHNFSDTAYQFISTYRKHFSLPEPLDGRRLVLRFEGVMTAAVVTVNDRTFDEHCGGYTPFQFDITDAVDEQGDNTITVQVDSRERDDIPPFGGRIDYLTFGGIYRDVSLQYLPRLHITNLRSQTHDVLSDTPSLSVDLFVRNEHSAPVTFIPQVELHDAAGSTVGTTSGTAVTLAGQGEDTVTVRLEALAAVERWSPDAPVLYTLRAALLPTPDSPVREADSYPPVRIGFRTARFEHDGFYLNGEKLFLRGLNRHQTYPYIGGAAPKRLQQHDADVVRYQLGCNIVRTSHYPQSIDFLDRCDEIGLLVFEEIPGWQWLSEEEGWRELVLRDVRAMIERDWNHASIVLWGVRINESWDDEELYTRTNELAHQLDTTRQTGGVRFFPFSQFLEDVFTFNDFSDGVIEPPHTPYIITEFNGHMFPTKSFDNEERRVEHAVRHARIQSQAMTMGGVAGAIGWCAFDYNTHREFGSGDRICYHGVMDIFRLPKYAAYLYASQIAPDERVVLQAATGWTMGDRSAGGNDPLTIFSNCERIEIFVGDEKLGDYTPDHDNYPGLAYPPFTVKGLGMLWGQQLREFHVVGYIGDTVVAEQRISDDNQPAHLLLQSSHEHLVGDGADMLWLHLRIVDRYGNTLPYVSQIVHVEITAGHATLVGDTPLVLPGGQAGLLLRAGHTAGEVTIRATTGNLAAATATIHIAADM